MKIERDKFYRTRDGQKVRVVCTDAIGHYPVVGLAESETVCRRYRINGMWRDIESVTTEHDLIAEWIDAPTVDWSKMAAWHRWVAMGKSEKWYSFDVKPTASRIQTWEHVGNSLLIPPEYAPKWSGDWKESLTERPTE